MKTILKSKSIIVLILVLQLCGAESKLIRENIESTGGL